MAVAVAFLGVTMLCVLAVCLTLFFKLFAKPNTSDVTMVVLGSGGHTREMLEILSHVKPKNMIFLLAETDRFSETVFLKQYPAGHFIKIPRAREVGQSYFSSIFSTIQAILGVAGVVGYYRPALLITNGPGTALPVILVCKYYTIMRKFTTKIIFFESYCRIYRKSTCGKLAGLFVNRYVSDWKQLGFNDFSKKQFDKYITLKIFPE
ncbi:UDP-N-acetylglucosamine transferase subunit ALG14 [Spironucleus salmonicida]|uniref:UDP-N-acetylglucosamine transferase subunit ALG14 n=1 Tax=Spironucleus salmonicida TaxID=348837 RepID=V6LMY2_9EUKA|nr:UDP-N-acetylglucosamine transferase subunit ALG14 [Spironucleus salmonicida]|eukprot:EST45990.1 UDP-N-acetylglucosamine transferase subunit ALG14 [Spironucleus salmonicida]